ncbi:hypothetical protein [Deefgea rivuli]|uniref:hypothetical protein n=1 Tax=Deefgea rivuli TaxID=400948 RepID=UPI0004852724|nr:hypothetical protein [Deefgea rivuli]
MIEHICPQQAALESQHFWNHQNALLLTEQGELLIGITRLRLLPQLNALGLLAHTTHLWLASPDLTDDINEAAAIYAKQHGAIRIETARLAPPL